MSWLPQGRLKFLLVTQILTPTQCPQVPGTLGNSHRQHRRRHRRTDTQTDAVLLRTRPQPGGPSPVMTARAQASPGPASRAHHAPSACPPDRARARTHAQAPPAASCRPWNKQEPQKPQVNSGGRLCTEPALRKQGSFQLEETMRSTWRLRCRWSKLKLRARSAWKNPGRRPATLHPHPHCPRWGVPASPR